ncbi:MAG: pre-peptidase C-terminal domain-containing protein [Actinomycetota bacterium]
MYVRNGAKPTTSTYDGQSVSSTSTESVTINDPAGAYWYVGVYVYSGNTALNYTITATYS